MLTWINEAEVAFAKFLCCEVITPAPFPTGHWKKVGRKFLCTVHTKGPCTKGWELHSPFFRLEYKLHNLHKLFGILLHRRLVSSPSFTNSFSPLFISVETHGYVFHIQIIVQCYLILWPKSFQLGHWLLFHLASHG